MIEGIIGFIIGVVFGMVLLSLLVIGSDKE